MDPDCMDPGSRGPPRNHHTVSIHLGVRGVCVCVCMSCACLGVHFGGVVMGVSLALVIQAPPPCIL